MSEFWRGLVLRSIRWLQGRSQRIASCVVVYPTGFQG